MRSRLRHHAAGADRGVTLLELVIVLVLIGVLVALALPPQGAARDRAAVRAATRELAQLVAVARELAVARGAAAVLLDTAGGAARLRAPGTAAVELPLATKYDVRLVATRDSFAFDARGLGRGAANARLVVGRGAAAETLTVSRLGRVRY